MGGKLTNVGAEVGHVGGKLATAHLAHWRPPVALPGGQGLVSHSPKKETLTGPVYPPSGSLSGAGGGTVCVWGRIKTCFQNT